MQKSLVLIGVTTFLMGSFSFQCGGARHSQVAIASTTAATCPPPPCAERKMPSTAMSEKAAARIAAAKKARDVMKTGAPNGAVSADDVFRAEELVFTSMRDSGIASGDLVAGATDYVAAAHAHLDRVKAQAASFLATPTTLARAEYAVAEADFWLEEAKTR